MSISELENFIAQCIADKWDSTRDPVEMCDVFAKEALRAIEASGHRVVAN